MPRQRRNFSGTEKMAILREHLIEKVPISEVCDKHGLQPAMFYQWQKKLFENEAAVIIQTLPVHLMTDDKDPSNSKRMDSAGLPCYYSTLAEHAQQCASMSSSSSLRYA